MRKVMMIGAAFGLLASSAFAQPAANGPQNGAVNSPDKPQPANPVAGRNSFTEGEAKSRIEARGFTNVTDLVKDDTGVWRGHAMKGGQKLAVSLDYQGNVIAQ